MRMKTFFSEALNVSTDWMVAIHETYEVLDAALSCSNVLELHSLLMVTIRGEKASRCCFTTD